MKKPRDILFARHQAAAPKLDALRQQVIQTRFPSGGEIRVSFVLRLWLELVLPCRRIWTGLAVVWILLFIVNLSQRDHSPVSVAKSSPTAQMEVMLADQQKLLNELLADRSPPLDADRPRNFVPKPRTASATIVIV